MSWMELFLALVALVLFLGVDRGRGLLRLFLLALGLQHHRFRVEVIVAAALERFPADFTRRCAGRVNNWAATPIRHAV